MILASGILNSSLSLTSSIRFSMFGNSSPNATMRVKPRAARFMNSCRSAPNRSRAGIGEAAEAARFEGGTGDDERAAEPFLVARLAVTVVGHVLGARRAHVVLDILVEDRERPRAEVRHHVLADEAVRVCEPLRVLVGRRV